MLKVLFAASECVPFIKTGGLADVVGALPPFLKAQDIDVRVVLPLYGDIPQEYKSQMKPVTRFEAVLGWRKQYCGIEELIRNGIHYYFVDNRYYFDRPYVYGVGGDEHERFAFFCRSVLDMLPRIGFQPDILHCHDWQAGMIPVLHKMQYSYLPFYSKMRSIMTVHNLQYQGVFDRQSVQDCLGLGNEHFTSDKLEFFGAANYLKSGLVYCDLITTVSPTYAEEITTPYYGERLDGLLRARHDQLSGVINGIDLKEYDPAADKHIDSPFSADEPAGKGACKLALQRELGLVQDLSVPLIGMVTRLSGQKGLDLVDCVLPEIMETGCQLAVLGKGEKRYEDLFNWAQRNWPGRVSAQLKLDFPLSHRIYAGTDMFLMPSLFEPCGLSQMIALRYGTLPIVRETGGLRDTVLSYNEFTGEGNGFTFFNYNAHDMLATIRRAVTFYCEKQKVWKKMMDRGMRGDYSWDKSAGEYIALYNRLMGGKNA